MPKVHLTALYASLALAFTGLLLAIAALAGLWMGYTEQQAQIAALEEREEALRGWVQSLDAWVNYLEVTQRDAQQETETLVEMSEEVTDWQNETDVWADGIVQWQADVAAYMPPTLV